MRKASLSTIPVYYDYQRMSPSSSTNANARNDPSNYYDSQCTSLFGDPVPPPPEDFLDNLDNHLYGNMRHGYYPTDLDAEDLSKTQTYLENMDDCPKPAVRHLPSNVFTTVHELDATYTVNERLRSPRLPPDIQILPDSGESSSENRNSPRYPSTFQHQITTGNNSLSPMQRYLNTNTSEDMTRRYSGFSEDVNANDLNSRQPTEIPKFPQPSTRRLHQQNSNESYSSQEWFKPSHDYQEFTKIPRLRPSSRSILSISHSKNTQESPVAHLINDSNGSSSSEERSNNFNRRDSEELSQIQPLLTPRPTDIFENELRSPHVLSPIESLRRSSITTSNNLEESSPENTPERPALPLSTHLVEGGNDEELSRDLPPVILTDCITTGADHRLQHHRSHKKSSFTIMAEKSPQSSRAPSPLAFPPTDRLSPFLGHGFKEPSKPVAMPRLLQNKSLSASHLMLPTIGSSSNNLNTSDDSPRPSVQFNMSSKIYNRSSPVKVSPVPKSILQLKLQENAAKSLPPISRISRNRSYENLPLPADPITGISRRGSILLTKPSADLATGSQSAKVTRPIFKNPNPTRHQRGLLEIVNSEEAKSKMHYSNWASLDDLTLKPRPLLAPISKFRRRSSSTSPERRSSTLTEPRSSIQSDRRSSQLSSITTSDFSYRRNSVSPPKSNAKPGARRKSIFQSTPKKTIGRSISYLNISRTPRKVAKPSTLSPIIGTPNKDSQTSSEEVPPGQNRLTRSSSISKIPVRGNSRGTSRSNSRVGSRSNSRGPSLTNSRTNSPQKELSSRPTSRIEQNRSTSRNNNRSDSRATSRGGSRPESRFTESRTSSRAESHTPSTFVSKNSSRSSSMLTQQTDKSKRDIETNRSRPISRFNKNQQSPTKRSSISPSKAASRPLNRTNSPSPKGKRRSSVSPPKRSRSQGRRSSRSRIPARIVTKQMSKSVSPPKIKHESLERSILRKEESSAKMAPKQIRKSESSGNVASSKVSKDASSFKTSKVTSSSKTSKDTFSSKTTKDASSTKANKDVAFKRDSSNLNRSSTNLKREQSSLQKSNSNLKREPSRLSLKKSTGAINEAAKKNADGKPGTIRREPSNMTLKSNESKKSLLKTRTDSNVSKKLEKKGSFKNEKKQADGGGGGGGAGSKNNGQMEGGKSGGQGGATSDGGVGGGGGGRSSTDGKSTPSGHAGSGLVTPLTARKAASQKEQSGGHQKTKQSSRTPTPTSEAGQILGSEDLKSLPNAILEKSQKTLETIQKTVTEATDEIHKTINENLTDLKSMESGMGQLTDGFGTSAPFEKSENLKTILETTTDSEKSAELLNSKNASDIQMSNKTPLHSNQPIEASVSVINSQKLPNSLNVPTNTNNGSSSVSSNSPAGVSLVNNIASNGSGAKNDQMASEEMAERVSERAISVLPEVECESANLQNYDVTTAAGADALADNDESNTGTKKTSVTGTNTGPRQHTTLEGGDHLDNNNGSGSQEFLSEEEKEPPRGCCSCCSRICMPCRRWRICRCCKKKPKSDSDTAAVIVEEIDEKPKQSCWKRMKCCKRKTKTSDSVEEILGSQKMEIIAEQNEERSLNDGDKPPKRNKCGLCLRKFFCCRPTNKVETSTLDVEKPRKCCFCIPCRRKKTATPDMVAESQIAWQNTEAIPNDDNTENILNDLEAEAPPVQGSRCSRFMNKLKCWKKKPLVPAGSRRASVKQGNAPLSEDTRSKLHVDLVEFNSKMKGAIPVMPLYLAWLCAICNTLVPGLGTVLSGFFCLCVGIPRFSQYDSAKARFGSFFINCIVGVAQLFCVLFCFVGWGWSIWWGTIMLKAARKLKKIKRVEVLEMEEDQRQAAAAAIAATATKTAEKDVEAAKTAS